MHTLDKKSMMIKIWPLKRKDIKSQKLFQLQILKSTQREDIQQMSQAMHLLLIKVQQRMLIQDKKHMMMKISP